MGTGGCDLKIIDTHIAGVHVIESTAVQDERGAFSRLFCAKELHPVLCDRQIVQINHSITHRVGAVRGMHFQEPPHAEMKIVRCLKGRVFDVAIDLRRGSPTFLQWISIELSPENRQALVIPEGCAHGFQVLDAHSELLYLHTAFYTPSSEGAVRFDDARIGIEWPLEPTDISVRDQCHLDLEETFLGITL